MTYHDVESISGIEVRHHLLEEFAVGGCVFDSVGDYIEMNHLMHYYIVPFVFGQVEGCAQADLEVTVERLAVRPANFFVAHLAQKSRRMGEVDGNFEEEVTKAYGVKVLESFLGFLFCYFHDFCLAASRLLKCFDSVFASPLRGCGHLGPIWEPQDAFAFAKDPYCGLVPYPT